MEREEREELSSLRVHEYLERTSFSSQMRRDIGIPRNPIQGKYY